jgi:rSAM/selenodomain-associated transferase 1
MKSTYPILDPSSPATPARGGCALAVMIKAPRAGASKTRLVPPLTNEEAAALSVCFLRDTAANIAAACEATASAAHGVAVYTPVGAETAFDGLLPASFSLLAQRGEGFGERLFNAATDLLAYGFDSLCLIDSDSPTLPTRALVAAVDELSQHGDRLVIGAADDGGYYLVGIKSAHARLFEEIDWSTARVFTQTVERAREIDLSVVQLPAWYDVDDDATLARLCAELFGATDSVASCDPTAAPNVEGCDASHNVNANAYAAPHTRDFLARLIAREGRARIWREGSDEFDETTPATDAHASSAGECNSSASAEATS